MTFEINLYYVAAISASISTVIYFAIMHQVPKHEYKHVSNNALSWAVLCAVPALIISSWTGMNNWGTFGYLGVITLGFPCWMIGAIIAVARNK